MKYVSVIVDNNTNATDELYTYGSEFSDVRPGNRVSIPFSKSNRIVDGYVAAVFNERPDGIKSLKNIRTIDPEFSLTAEEIETAIWMRSRYMCRYIEAVRCFLPTYTLSKRKTKDPFENIAEIKSDALKLNDEQRNAYDKIASCLDAKQHDIFLLFGVTGSGKTEVYLQAMQKCLNMGRQGLILVPEISLTPQTVARFVNRFGKENVAILHSKLTPAQRAAEYKKIKDGDAKIVIGVRSAIFAPFNNIGLIVLDEEHETSYKSDKSPKYDAIEVATKRAIAHNAVLVLGSATPSVVDYYRGKKKIFKTIELRERYNKVPLPKTSIVDMRGEVKNGNRSLFSGLLAEEIQKSFDDGKQVILFLNRRGYAGFVSCRECGFTMKCPDCGITMTYHKDTNAMLCHYCGKRRAMPKLCPECGSKVIGRFGAGTEQLEEKANELFPGKVIERLDLDTAKKKGSAESILKRFAKGKTDMLIGTQLVAKGLDFANVGLVGVISADLTLNIPDFRSSERAFQLITQASGRSGRGDERGKVIIQTYSPDSPAIRLAADQDYEAFYDYEIKIRDIGAYPPFTDVFQIVVSDRIEQKALGAAERLEKVFEKELGEAYTVLGPCKAPINKSGDMYRYQIIIKSPAGERRRLSALVNEIKRGFCLAELMTVDINPYSLV